MCFDFLKVCSKESHGKTGQKVGLRQDDILKFQFFEYRYLENIKMSSETYQKWENMYYSVIVGVKRESVI